MRQDIRLAGLIAVLEMKDFVIWVYDLPLPVLNPAIHLLRG